MTTRLIALTDWNDYHSWPPQGGLRHLVFHAKTNKFDQVVRRIGRRVLIDEAAFFEWASKNGGSQSAK
jgi:hypothetical protein